MFWLLSSLMTLLFSGLVVVPATAANAAARPKAAAPGTIEICKSAANGMSGRAFNFTLNGGSAITVNGGACSGAISTAAGVNTVVEAPTAGLEVKAIQANHVVSKDPASGTVIVTVKAGSTAGNETLVTFVNEPIPAIGLKVCKAAGNLSPSLIGKLFSFTENGGSAFSVTAGTVAAPSCGPVQPYQLGTLVNVAELATPGTHVSSIAVSDGRGSNTNTAARTVTATVGSGVTIVTYTNDVDPPVQNGYVEVCKSAGDAYVYGSFTFTITDSTGLVSTQPVLVNQCTSQVKVAAGNVTIAEAAHAPYFVSEIDVFPSGRVVTSNLSNQTITVTVPVGDTSNETLVNFVNSTHDGLVKVCKTLTSNSGALAGHTFYFNVTNINGTHSVSVIAGAAGTTTCVIDWVGLPIGSSVSITEQAVTNVQVVGVSVSPSGQDAGSSGTTAKLTVGSGVTTATFTNEAFGTVEICKKALDASTATRTFQFSVNGGTPIWVHAGGCSLPITVPAGTASVLEVALNNFHLVSISAFGPTGDSRIVSGGNPVTVSTPYGGVSNETVVTFYNAVDTGSFKICKLSPETSLATTTFNFTYSYTNGTPVSVGPIGLTPGSCSGFSDSIPVVDPTGNPINITVTEAPTATVAVSSIVVDPGTATSTSLGTGTVIFHVGQGFTTVTYTNVRTPPVG
jgi:hypothetical protein